MMPLSDGHLDWMAHIKNEAVRAGIGLSVCILEYDSWDDIDGKEKTCIDCTNLIPANPYPRQMTQGIFALRHLLTSGYRPSDVRLPQPTFFNKKANVDCLRFYLGAQQVDTCPFVYWLICTVTVPLNQQWSVWLT